MRYSSFFVASVVVVLISGVEGQQSAVSKPFVEPSNFPLELVYPREVGTSPASDNVIPFGNTTAFPAAHRVNKAFPGIQLDIASMAIGGSLPYHWALSGAPDGMEIDERTGRIVWPLPVTGDYSIDIAVTDAEGTIEASIWKLDVTTEGFYFVDPARGDDANPGTLQSPWSTKGPVFALQDPDGVVYWYTGAYGPSRNDKLENSGEIAEAVGIPDRSPRIWIAYPGERPVWDAGRGTFSRHGATLNVAGLVYIDGWRFTNQSNKLLHVFGTSYKVFKDVVFDNIVEGRDGANPAAIMTAAHYGSYDYYQHIVGCSATRLTGAGLFKIYSQRKWLVESCTTDATVSAGSDPKAAVPRGEIRYNFFVGPDLAIHNDRAVLYGNFDPQTRFAGHVALDGEVRFNFFRAMDVRDPVLELGAGADRYFVYRNTLIGRPWSRWVTSGRAPSQHSWYRNVIINNDSRLQGISITGVDTFSPDDDPMNRPPPNIRIYDNLSGDVGQGIIDFRNGSLLGEAEAVHGPDSAEPRGAVPSFLPVIP